MEHPGGWCVFFPLGSIPSSCWSTRSRFAKWKITILSASINYKSAMFIHFNSYFNLLEGISFHHFGIDDYIDYTPSMRHWHALTMAHMELSEHEVANLQFQQIVVFVPINIFSLGVYHILDKPTSYCWLCVQLMISHMKYSTKISSVILSYCWLLSLSFFKRVAPTSSSGNS